MKFFNNLIALVASTVLFSGVQGKALVKREVKLEVNENTLIVDDPLCQNDLNSSVEYQQCYLPTITTENYKDLCVTLTSAQCQQFYADPMVFLPNCVNEVKVTELLSPTIISSTISSIKFICNTDENGEICPLAEDLLDGQNIKEKALHKTCRSKNCINSALEMYSSLQTNNLESLSITTGNNDDEYANRIVEVLNYLQSDECVNYKSGAVTLTLGRSFILSLVVLCLFLHF